MNNKLTRRDLLRKTTVTAAAASSTAILNAPAVSFSSPENSLDSKITNRGIADDFSKLSDLHQKLRDIVTHFQPFVGEGHEYRPLSYWSDINFLDKSEGFSELEGQEIEIALFSAGWNYPGGGYGYFQVFGGQEKENRYGGLKITAKKCGEVIVYQIYGYGTLNRGLEKIYSMEPANGSAVPFTLRELCIFLDHAFGYEGYDCLVEAAWERLYEEVRLLPASSYRPLKAFQVPKIIEIKSSFYPELHSFYRHNSWIESKLKELAEEHGCE